MIADQGCYPLHINKGVIDIIVVFLILATSGFNSGVHEKAAQIVVFLSYVMSSRLTFGHAKGNDLFFFSTFDFSF